MTILDQIILDKRKQIVKIDKAALLIEIGNSRKLDRECISLKSKFESTIYPLIISEFKHKSPSKQNINLNADVVSTINMYEEAGVSAVSVLTEGKYFGGSFSDLEKARATINLPILCKDFMVDEIQVYQAKAAGADIILIIAAAIDISDALKIAKTARTLGMEILLELHSAKELCYMDLHPDFVGINNRNLKTFEVDLQHSINLAEKIPLAYYKIAESGISSPDEVKLLYRSGFRGFLIGEHFMRSENPKLALNQFINDSKLQCK